MSLIDTIEADLLGVSKATLAFLVGTFKALEANPQVQVIATQEVTALEDAVVTGAISGSAATGAAKFVAAQTGVVAKLTAAGLPVVMNQVNLAIEGAVANLPAKVAAPVAAVAAAVEAPAEAVITAKAEAAAATVDASSADDAPAGTTDAPAPVEAPAASTSEG